MRRRVLMLAASNVAVGTAGLLALVTAVVSDDEQRSPPPPATTEVVARAGSFTGPEVVRPGEVVVFQNRDTRDHSFTAESGLFDSGVLAPGDEYRWSAGGARAVRFHCEIHPRMQATLVVADA